MSPATGCRMYQHAVDMRERQLKVANQAVEVRVDPCTSSRHVCPKRHFPEEMRVD